MENEISKKSAGLKSALIVICAFTGLFLVFFMVMSLMSPGRCLDRIEAEYAPKSDGREKINPEIYADSAWLSLMKAKAYYQSRTLMAQSDSIYGTINLDDSTLSIGISGVTVHTARISHFEISKILQNCDKNILYTMLASPFSIENSVASIKKEPVMIKVAPKDTSEYKPDIMPDTSITEPVNYILELNGGSRIYVYQEEDEISEDRRSRFMFDLNDRIHDTWRSLRSIVVFRVPEYKPYIKIMIPRDDAKIIYRALPKNGQIAIFT